MCIFSLICIFFSRDGDDTGVLPLLCVSIIHHENEGFPDGPPPHQCMGNHPERTAWYFHHPWRVPQDHHSKQTDGEYNNIYNQCHGALTFVIKLHESWMNASISLSIYTWCLFLRTLPNLCLQHIALGWFSDSIKKTFYNYLLFPFSLTLSSHCSWAVLLLLQFFFILIFFIEFNWVFCLFFIFTCKSV